MYLKKRLTPETRKEILPTLLTHYPRLKDQIVCDFCGDDNTEFVYGAVRSSTGMKRKCWRWCACEACSESIEKNDWGSIMRRALPTATRLMELAIGSKVPEALAVAAVMKAFETFLQDVDVGYDV